MTSRSTRELENKKNNNEKNIVIIGDKRIYE